MILELVILILRNTLKNTEFNDKEFIKLSGYSKDRMLEPTQIKRRELMFYFEENLRVKIDHLVFIKHTRVKTVCNEIRDTNWIYCYI